MRIWARIVTENRLEGESVITIPDKAKLTDLATFREALSDICRELDLSRPVILKKHENEMLKHMMTTFKPHDFMEGVGFDKLEIIVIVDKDAKKQNGSPIDRL